MWLRTPVVVGDRLHSYDLLAARIGSRSRATLGPVGHRGGLRRCRHRGGGSPLVGGALLAGFGASPRPSLGSSSSTERRSRSRAARRDHVSIATPRGGRMNAMSRPEPPAVPGERPSVPRRTPARPSGGAGPRAVRTRMGDSLASGMLTNGPLVQAARGAGRGLPRRAPLCRGGIVHCGTDARPPRRRSHGRRARPLVHVRRDRTCSRVERAAAGLRRHPTRHTHVVRRGVPASDRHANVRHPRDPHLRNAMPTSRVSNGSLKESGRQDVLRCRPRVRLSAPGADGRGFGDAEVFSLSPTKVLVAGEGGLITTNDDLFAERCRIGRDYGQPGRLRLPVHRPERTDVRVPCGGRPRRRSRISRSGSTSGKRSPPHTGDPRGPPRDHVPGRDGGGSQHDQRHDDPRRRRGVRSRSRRPGTCSAAEGIETKRYYSPPVHTMQAYRSLGARWDPST